MSVNFLYRGIRGGVQAKVLLVILTLVISGRLYSQTETDTATKESFIKAILREEIPGLPNSSEVTIGGYYRFYAINRVLSEQYPGSTAGNRLIGVGDGYREPILFFNLGVQPTQKLYVGTDFYLFSPYRGYTGLYNGNQLNLNLGVNMVGGISTKSGDFNISAGGITWRRLTPFTLWSVSLNAYNRYSIFDRNPWEPVEYNHTKYRRHYNEGQINQDARWDRQAFQGIAIDGVKLPGNMAFSLLYGKTLNNGGGASYLSAYAPNTSWGGRVVKNIKDHYVSINTFNGLHYIDSLHNDTKQYDIVTTEFKLRTGTIRYYGEIGMGSYASPTYTRAWSEALSLKVLFPKSLTFLPIELQLYQVGRNIVNANSLAINTTISEAFTSFSGNSSGTVFPNNSPMLDLGMVTNNRRGFNINTDFKIQKLRINVGNGMASEIEKSGPGITFGQRINGLALSRIYNFSYTPANFGPYQNLTPFFRGVFQKIYLTDTLNNGGAAYLKYFNNLEAQAKYKVMIAKRVLHLHYVGAFSSVQKFFSPTTVFSDKAYIRTYYHEFEAYLNVIPKVSLAGYFGLQRILGNADTQLGDKVYDNGGTAPTNQTSHAYGVGIDINVSDNAGFFVRHRWFDHNDKNFVLDKYKGQETTVELKIFF